MIVDATIIGIKRRALGFSANCHAKRQFYVHYESMAFCIDLNDLKCEFQVEESWAGLAHDFFWPGPGGSRPSMRTSNTCSHPAGSARSAQTISSGALTTAVGQLA